LASDWPQGHGLASYGQSHSQSQNAKLVQRYLGQKAMVWLPIAKAIGHSDVATTLRYYVDVFPEDLGEAAEMLAQR